MDSPAEPTPAKKRCTMTNRERKQAQRCVRKFQLQRHFPSTMKQALMKGISVVKPVAPSLAHSDNARVSSNEETRVPCTLQKLRILSPKGRDLGEFNVEVKSLDPSKGNTITITKSNFKSIDKPLTLPLSPVTHVKALPRILKPGSRKIPKTNLMEVMSCSRRISRADNSSVSQQRQFEIPPMSKMLLNDQGVEGKMEKRLCNNSNITTDETPCTDDISYIHSVYRTVDSNQKHVTNHATDDTDCSYIRVQETAAENKEISTETVHEEIIELPYLPRTLAINSSNRKIMPPFDKSRKVSKGKCIAIIKKTENGKIVTSLKSAANLVQKYDKVDKTSNRSINCNRKSSNSSQVSYDKNNTLQAKPDIVPNGQVPEMKTQNVMTIIPNDETLSFNQNAVVTQENNTPVASANVDTANVTDHGTVRHDAKCDDTQSKGSKAESRNNRSIVSDDPARHISELQQIINTSATVQSNVQNTNLPQTDLSNSLNIIKKAMDSVKDNELRDLALKALADCGIGIERYVPKCPPKGHKAVHDSQVQTVVFGLLDPKSFILINKDLEDIHKLSQITLHHIPPKENRSLADKTYSNNLVSNDSPVFKDLHETNRESIDLDSFMEQFWKEDSDALKIKETLSVSKIRCDSLLEHLQRDFECVKRYDQDGMLNVHNAVLSDNVYLVRRQLMILEHCKESVDILTEDGATSLELAIKYDVCSEIVKLLLDAGAQPVIPKPIHESAVIIASKQSSPLLSMLVNRVSNSKLLDQIDSDGFAALHYCSIRGNLPGVKALISAGATVDLKDMKSGRTSLFHAIDNSHTPVMQELLQAGAVASIANYAGQTVLSVIIDPKNISLRVPSRKDLV